jgi:glucose-1-phosphate cytidylyltransferase
MTGGRIKRIEPYVDADTLLATYGDGLADVRVDDLLAFHRSHGKLATITATRPPSRYGILELSEEDRVLRFCEKVQAN